MEQNLSAHFKHTKIISIPVADGGEGSVDCFLTAIGGEKVTVNCSGPYGEKMQGFYGLIDGGNTAVIEMAAVAGLPLVENNKNPMLTTTFGVGELMIDAVNKGVKKIILGLGGSCTNDFACGLAVACGIKFYDKNGKAFLPTGGTLKNICEIDFNSKNKIFENIEIEVMCDIDNPPFGQSGAACVFAPQKGADERQVKLLDSGVKHVCLLIKETFGQDLSSLKGGGAAGAMGAGMVAFFGAKLKMGIDVVLDTVGFDELIKDADCVLTGEGKLDGQSLGGKVVIGVARRANKQGVPVIAVVGGAEGNMTDVYNQGVTAIFTINRLPQDFSVSRNFAKENLAFAMDNFARALKIQVK